MDLPSVVIVYVALAFVVVCWALQCARPLVLDVLRWLRARGY